MCCLANTLVLKNNSDVHVLQIDTSACCALQAGSILSAGMGMFCGALYYHALTGDPVFTKAAPYGGTLFILGWIAMVP